MATTETNGANKNGAKPRWKRPKEKKHYSEAEMRLIKASRDVLDVIREMKEEGEFDYILKNKKSKV